MIAAVGVTVLVAVVTSVVCGWTHLPAAGITLHPKPKPQPEPQPKPLLERPERPVPSWATR